MASFFCCAGDRDDRGEEDGSVVKEARGPINQKRGDRGSSLEMSDAVEDQESTVAKLRSALKREQRAGRAELLEQAARHRNELNSIEGKLLSDFARVRACSTIQSWFRFWRHERRAAEIARSMQERLAAMQRELESTRATVDALSRANSEMNLSLRSNTPPRVNNKQGNISGGSSGRSTTARGRRQKPNNPRAPVFMPGGKSGAKSFSRRPSLDSPSAPSPSSLSSLSASTFMSASSSFSSSPASSGDPADSSVSTGPRLQQQRHTFSPGGPGSRTGGTGGVWTRDWTSQVAQVSTPQWRSDSARGLCGSCGAVFNWLRHKHHCRLCGELFCGGCSAQNRVLPAYLTATGPQINTERMPRRVCDSCCKMFDGGGSVVGGFEASGDGGAFNQSSPDQPCRRRESRGPIQIKGTKTSRARAERGKAMREYQSMSPQAQRRNSHLVLGGKAVVAAAVGKALEGGRTPPRAAAGPTPATPSTRITPSIDSLLLV